MSESADVAVAAFLITVMIADTFGNSLVILTIKKNRDMRTPLDFLLGNLAISDIMFAVFQIPKHLLKRVFTHLQGVAGTALCIVLTNGLISAVGAASSSFTLVAIAFERYFMVMLPPGNKWKLKKRKVTVIIYGCWIFSVVFSLPLFLVTRFDESIGDCTCKADWPSNSLAAVYELTIWIVLLSFIPLVVMTCLYFRVVHSLWFKRTNGDNPSFQPQGVLKVRKRVTLTVITISAIFGVCWITGGLVYALSYFDIYMFGPVSFAVADTLFTFNAAVNPFVYSLLNARFREKVKASLCCSCATRVHTQQEG